MPVIAKRLQDSPIIYPDMDERMGDNINGPSIIRVPDWVNNPLGRYYLYFAHHKGQYIRMAYADEIMGPWTMYVPGVLDVANSLFEPTDPPEPAPEDRPFWAASMKGGYLYAHIASPDVHADNENNQIRMYYHGLLRNGDQQTRIAYSPDGLSFTPREPLLGQPYFSAFPYGEWVYVIAATGLLMRSRSWDGPFEVGQILPDVKSACDQSRVIRHANGFVKRGELHILYTCIGDCPERIFHSKITLRNDWATWVASVPEPVLEPALDWEGTGLPLAHSEMGAASGRVRELRDPFVFEDEGKLYLLYCGAGESGIGLAALKL